MQKSTIINVCKIFGTLFSIILITIFLIIFGTSPLPENNRLDTQSVFNTIDYTTLPPQSYFILQNKSAICYREYPAAVDRIIIYIHGITNTSRNMHGIADYMSSNNIAHGFALDMRGHGSSGEKGKIDYIGQLEDDTAEIIRRIRYKYPPKKTVILGFDEGGGFAIRFAGSEYGTMVKSYIFLSPFLHQDTPVNRPPDLENEEQRMSLYLPRILGLSIINLFGITSFNDLSIVEYRIPELFQEEYTSAYSYNLYENFRPHRDYIGDIRKVQINSVLLAGRKDEKYIPQKYIDELEKFSKRLTFDFIDDADHFDMILDEKVFKRIAATLP